MTVEELLERLRAEVEGMAFELEARGIYGMANGENDKTVLVRGVDGERWKCATLLFSNARVRTITVKDPSKISKFCRDAIASIGESADKEAEIEAMRSRLTDLRAELEKTIGGEFVIGSIRGDRDGTPTLDIQAKARPRGRVGATSVRTYEQGCEKGGHECEKATPYESDDHPEGYELLSEYERGRYDELCLVRDYILWIRAVDAEGCAGKLHKITRQMVGDLAHRDDYRATPLKYVAKDALDAALQLDQEMFGCDDGEKGGE